MKKEFKGPGLLGLVLSVHADHAWPPFQWTLNSVFSAYGKKQTNKKPKTQQKGKTPSRQGNLKDHI